MIRNNVFFLFILLCFSVVEADDLETKDQMRYQSLIQEVRCLVCQNQSVAESNAELAKDLRREIKLQIQEHCRLGVMRRNRIRVLHLNSTL